MDERKRALKILTYDDVLIRLRDTLVDPERGPAACARLRERYDVVLVDEFQDTDPVQWDIMHRAFGAGRRDPGPDRRPQAGDLRLPRRRRARLPRGHARWCSPSGRSTSTGAATRGCSRPTTRSSPTPSSAMPASRTGRSGRPTPTSEPRLVGARSTAPLRVRIVHADDGLVPLTQTRRQPQAPEPRELHRPGPRRRGRRSCSRPRPRAHHPAPRRRRGRAAPPLHPGHIAVLVRANSQAMTVRDALPRRGRPGGHRRCRLGLRDRAGARVAPPARGARAADGARPGVAGRPDLLRRLDARRGRHGRRGPSGRTCTGRCTDGRRSCATRASPRSTRR